MASTVELIQELLSSTAHSIIQSPDAWLSFLSTAAWHYKYTFSEQRIIHSYKPDATACATYDEWNNVLHRQIRNGTSGIPLLSEAKDDDGSVYIRCVYDVSDTFCLSDEPFSIWKHNNAYEARLINLFNEHSDTEKANSFLSAIFLQAQHATNSYYREYYDKQNTNLVNTSSVFDPRMIKCMTLSAFYMVCTRCELEKIPQISPDDLSGLKDLRSISSIDIFGRGVGNVARSVIKEIFDAEKVMKEQKLEDSIGGLEDGKNYDAGNGSGILLGRRDIHPRSAEEPVRGTGRNISLGGTVPYAEREVSGAGAGKDRHIWKNEASILEGESSGRAVRDDVRRDAGTALEDDRRSSERTVGSASQEVRKETKLRRRPEAMGGRLAGLRGNTDQYTGNRATDDSKRTGIQIDLFSNADAEPEAEISKVSAFFLPQNDIDHVIRLGSGVEDGKFRIYFFYQDLPKLKDSVAFLKAEYGQGGSSISLPSGQSGFADHDSKGIRIRVYDQNNSDSEVLFKWNKIDARIRMLIQTDRYLSPYEKSQIILKKKEYISPILPRRSGRGRIVQKEEKSAPIIDPIEILVGDTVFVGTDAFLVLFYGEDEVVLQDSKYPLLTENMSRTDFD